MKNKKRTLTPCLDCPDRFPACHDHCERYQLWKEDHERKRAEARKQENQEIVGYEMDRARKLKKKKG